MNNVYIHATALVETQHIGRDTRVWAYTHVMKDVTIGDHCNIGEHCFIESGASIGNCVTIKNGNELWEGIRLADGVFVGPNVSFTNDLRPRSPRLPQTAGRYRNHEWLLRTVVKEGASIGAAAIILPGMTIGMFAMIGAGAVVTHDVPDYALVIGTPARLVGWVCYCGCRLAFQNDLAACESCDREFVREGTSVRPRRDPVAV